MSDRPAGQSERKDEAMTDTERAKRNAEEVVERGDTRLPMALLADAIGLLCDELDRTNAEVGRLRKLIGPREHADV